MDDAIVGFLSVFTTSETPPIVDNSQFIIETIHDQRLEFSTEGTFKYSSVLVYLFIYHQENSFSFPLQKLHDQSNPQSIILWTSLVRKNSTEHTFSDYVDQFLHIISYLLNHNIEPRIGLEI